ncbi:MAG: multicopper oxidase domain-containing protein [Candidatus Geothermarchaeales archaeon]
MKPTDTDDNDKKEGRLSRRELLKMAPAAALAVGAGAMLLREGQSKESFVKIGPSSHDPALCLSDEGAVKYNQAVALSSSTWIDNFQGPGIDPAKFLYDFDYGTVSEEKPNGTSVREYYLEAIDKEIEVAHGVYYPAWTYNGQVPGPTLRCTEGDTVRLHFTNKSTHNHTVHFHGIHPASMDGVFETVRPGESFTYEFTAEPFGVHEYHCHIQPLTKHISKGLYGTFIVDPKPPRPPATEMVMVMNGFDVNFDGENEFYTINGFANYHVERPIELKVGEPVRVYLVNMTEFDPVNSIHLHANFFRLYQTGTKLDEYEFTDTAMFCQGERAILEFSYKFPGVYLFHAHQSEFAELGWLGHFNVTE